MGLREDEKQTDSQLGHTPSLPYPGLARQRRVAPESVVAGRSRRFSDHITGSDGGQVGGGGR